MTLKMPVNTAISEVISQGLNLCEVVTRQRNAGNAVTHAWLS